MVRTSQSLCLISTLLLLLSINAKGQGHFINYTSQDGLISDHVSCAVEDQEGYMWFGTSNGICRFNGFEFRDYSIYGNGDVPGNIEILDVAIDKENNLWVATDRMGLYCFNQTSRSWTRYSNTPGSKNRIPANRILFVYPDHNGNIWAGCESKGLIGIKVGIDTIVNVTLDHIKLRSRWLNNVYDMIVNPFDSTIHYLVSHGQILEFNTETHLINELDIFSESNIGNRKFEINNLVIGKDSLFYTGSYGEGVFEFDMTNGAINNLNPQNFEEEVIWRSNVFDAKANGFWANYRKKGLAFYDYTSKEWNEFSPEPYNRNGLLNARYIGAYTTSNEDTWFYSTQGISHYVPEYQSFNYIPGQEEKVQFIRDLHYDSINGRYVAAYAGYGNPLKVYDLEFNLLSEQTIDYTRDFKTVNDLFPLENKLLLLAKEPMTYDITNDRIEVFNLPGYPKQDWFIQHMIQENESTFWSLSFNLNILKSDIDKGTFESISLSEISKILNNPNYRGIEVGQDYIWFYGESIVVLINKETHALKYFEFKGDGFNQIEHNLDSVSVYPSINQIHEYDKNCAWISTKGYGLFNVCLEDLQNLNVKRHLDKNDLPQLQNIVEFEEDEKGDFWIASNNGLVYSNPDFTSFRVFGQREGLRHQKLEEGIELTNEQIFLGLQNGFVQINKNELLSPYEPVNCKIEEASLSNIDLLSSIEKKFNHTNNLFQVKVSAPVFKESQTAEFAHRLVNLNDEWSLTKVQNTFTYDGLPPGDYSFEVKIRTQSREWGEVASISFKILPPFWKTWWFRIIGTLALIGILYYYNKRHTDGLLAKEQMKTKISEMEKLALRAQMNPHFIFNSLNSIRSLILMDKKDESLKYLNQFSQLVRQVLSNSNESNISLENELEILSNYIEIESLRFNNKFQYSINVNPSVDQMQQKIPPMLLQPYVENAIWHGLLHKESNAKLEINISEDESGLIIEIVDNGIGRKASEKLKSSKTFHRKKIHGMQINKSKIELLQNAQLEIEDLYDKDQALGTRVLIKLNK